MFGKKRKRIGDLLVDEGLLTREKMDQALAEASRSGTRVGQVLVRNGYISDLDLVRGLSRQLDIPWLSLSESPPDPELSHLVTPGLARRYTVVPHSRDEDSLVVAMADPLNVFALDALRKIIGTPVKRAIAPADEIVEWISELYGGETPIAGILDDAAMETVELGAGEESADRLERIAEETPVVRLVNAVLDQAVNERASDVHVEPEALDVRLRMRVDGVLKESAKIPLNMKLALVSRLKIISGMDIAEKRVPQDGRFRWQEQGREIDVRVSTLPTVNGEKIVLRLLDKSSGLLDLPQMGFSSDVVTGLRELIARPYGIVLVTGPTGSGKTTTLYAALREINLVGRNIVTVEDPVEYEIQGLNQVQVVPQIGLTFSSVLKSILRQDPDVVMIGEIRDAETANIAIHAALTGHLVFSTLHTTDAVGAIPRLLDMGVEPYLIRASLAGVVAQRLVRKLCEKCSEISLVPDEISAQLGEPWRDRQYFTTPGCSRCRQTGYLGRTGIAELLQVTKEVRDLMVQDLSRDEVMEAVLKSGYTTLREAGMAKAAEGVTSLEEVFRVTQDIDL